MKELWRKKSVKAALAVIVILVVVGIVSISAQSFQRRKEYNGHVEAAEKYLTELDYEQAIAEYTLALEIEPNNEEVLNALEQTYLDYAQSLVNAGDYGKAISVLEEGYAQIGRESLREKIENVKNLQAQREAEEQRLQEEAAKVAQKEEAREIINEAYSGITSLWRTYYAGRIYISDEEIRELCEPLVNAGELYLEGISEDDLVDRVAKENVNYERCLEELWCCYYLLGEYDLCMEKRWQYYKVCGFFEEDLKNNRSHHGTPVEHLEESYSDNDGKLISSYLVDEYGRELTITWYDNDPIGWDMCEYEYGIDGKTVKVTSSKEHAELVSMYEYDSSGRILKVTDHEIESAGWAGHETYRYREYEYHEGGYTEHTYRRTVGNNGAISGHEVHQDYEVDQYGQSNKVGDAYGYYEY